MVLNNLSPMCGTQGKLEPAKEKLKSHPSTQGREASAGSLQSILILGHVIILLLTKK